MHRVEVLGRRGLDPIRELRIVAPGIGDHLLPDILGERALTRDPQFLQPGEQRVERGHPPVGEPDRGVHQFRLGRSLGHVPDRRLVVRRRLGRHRHSLQHGYSL
ncbi:MAG: hypothetical protein E6H90_08150 [Chloroflexi bacterium]|nr:MAG: hypothetical protein E6H90_08150 [Chloroflexota bacterium]